MAYGARSHGAALAKGARGGGKAHELLRLCRDADLLRRLPRMARAARSPRNLHHSAKPAPNPKNRMKPGAERTFRIAGAALAETADKEGWPAARFLAAL